MSLREAFFKLWHNGRVFLRRTYHTDWTKTEKIFGQRGRHQGPTARASEGFSRPTSFVQSHFDSARRLFVDNVLRRVTNSLSGQLREKTTKQLLYGNSRPFFALVGVSLASGTGIITKQDELEGLCWEIREAVGRMQKSLSEAESDLFRSNESISLDKFTIGPPISKGSNGVVYAARKNDFPSSPSESDGCSELQVAPEEPIEKFPLALKMMFNYEIESNAFAIVRGMKREIVPARVRYTKECDSGCEDLLSENVYLPPHPNIVSIHCVFADYIPRLPGSLTLFPNALPQRLNPVSGFARNMSLFLLMKRYDATLTEHLKSEGVENVRDGVLLLTQLLEGVTHINTNGVAHRDLKSDNILLDTAEPDECPLLVVSDFGCCLADPSRSLTVPFRTIDTFRGGNPALMAPEIVCAEPGLFASLDYYKSDCWACGTLAYELFTGHNPFYAKQVGSVIQAPLRSATFRREDLPPLDSAPLLVQALVSSMLERNPSKRPSAEFAATVLQLYLWAPSSWQNSTRLPPYNEILEWLLCMTTKVLCGGLGGGKLPLTSRRHSDAEYLLIGSFLRRARLFTIRDALAWIQTCTAQANSTF